jgi:hypothetical protein
VDVVARLIEAFCYLFGSVIRLVVFTVMDGCEAVAKRFR